VFGITFVGASPQKIALRSAVVIFTTMLDSYTCDLNSVGFCNVIFLFVTRPCLPYNNLLVDNECNIVKVNFIFIYRYFRVQKPAPFMSKLQEKQ
jgi:hypothetical protein